MPYRSRGDGIGRGWFAIGVERVKVSDNVGTLYRSAVALGASFVFTIGKRYHRQASDTVATFRHMPVFHFDGLDDLHEHLPYGAPLVGVEISERSHPLETFAHPQRAVYLLGPEDGSLSPAALERCHDVVSFRSRYCLNVAAAGSIVMYDRRQKALRAS